jgi:FkbM family methyltransferase
VIAFEPSPEIFEILQGNVALNGYLNVTLENKAVADRTGLGALRLSTRLPLEGLDSIVPGNGSSTAIDVPMVRLDDYLDSGGARIDFVKIDVEGAESLALDGMSRILQQDRPTLVIELHGVERRVEDHAAVSRLRKMGYKVSVLDLTGGDRAHILAEAPAA